MRLGRVRGQPPELSADAREPFAVARRVPFAEPRDGPAGQRELEDLAPARAHLSKIRNTLSESEHPGRV